MRKILLIGLMTTFALSGCNTFKGFANGVGRDISAVGATVKGGGDYVQEKITPKPQELIDLE